MKELRLFVYGTLKVGQRAHEELCLPVVEAREARVRGTLHDSGHGFPELVVPEDDVLAVGTADPASDLVTQDRVVPLRAPEAAVSGELLALADARALAELDAYEGYVPGEGSRFVRVLLPVTTPHGTTTTAWAYVVPQSDGPVLPSGAWP